MNRLFVELVVWSLFGDEDVMNVAFTQRGVGDLHKPRFCLKLRDCAHTAISHSGSQPADQLHDHGGEWSFKGDAAFDTFRNKLPGQFLLLAVPVAAALLHRAERT